jgi:malate dehydrogenase
MSRRDLAVKNASAIQEIMENSVDNNPNAWYFIVTNPVDALATLANNVTHGKRHIIGTGTNLETSRFRTIISRQLGVPIGAVEAYVGGEHGEAAVLLWSTVRIDGEPLDDYQNRTRKKLDKTFCDNYVKEVSRQIITFLGGTRYGPAGSFIEIIRGILLNTGKFTSYSRLMKFETAPEPVFATVPSRIVKSLGPDIWALLPKAEQQAIKDAAGAIYKTYLEAMGGKS